MSEASRARMAALNSQRSKERRIETASLLTLQQHSDLARYIKEALRQRKMEALTQLAGGIGHDLNNHLYPAINSLETMQRHAHSEQNDGLKNRIERVLRSIHGAAALDKRLVAFARPRVCHMNRVLHHSLLILVASLTLVLPFSGAVARSSGGAPHVVSGPAIGMSMPASGAPLGHAMGAMPPLRTSPAIGSRTLVPLAPITRAPTVLAPPTAPLARVPIIGPPMTRVPMVREPMLGAPMPGTPITRPPTARAPMTAIPMTGTPTTGAPIASQPQAQSGRGVAIDPSTAFSNLTSSPTPTPTESPTPPSAIAEPITPLSPVAPLSPQLSTQFSSGGSAVPSNLALSPGSSTSSAPTPGGGGETLQDCMSFWDSETHMTKAEWRAACTRTQHRLEALSADSFQVSPGKNKPRMSSVPRVSHSGRSS